MDAPVKPSFFRRLATPAVFAAILLGGCASGPVLPDDPDYASAGAEELVEFAGTETVDDVTETLLRLAMETLRAARALLEAGKTDLAVAEMASYPDIIDEGVLARFANPENPDSWGAVPPESGVAALERQEEEIEGMLRSAPNGSTAALLKKALVSCRKALKVLRERDRGGDQEKSR